MAKTDAGRWTVTMLDVFPENDGKRYEIIDGELFVSGAPANKHQIVVNRIAVALTNWNDRTRLGVVIPGAGVLFSETDAVIPDLLWVSHEQLARHVGSDDKLHGAPELMVEVLSPGAANERRDREAKLRLYEARGVEEYWIVDPREQVMAVYRREGERLTLAVTLASEQELASPLLPGFAVLVARLFE
jgi:Uma2 family endonuclease